MASFLIDSHKSKAKVETIVFFLSIKCLYLCTWQIGTTSSFRIPQVLTEARVGGRCGEILGLPFFMPFPFNYLHSFCFWPGFSTFVNILTNKFPI